MKTYTATFPEIETKENPIIDLYKKTLTSVGMIFGKEKLNVSDFKVHPKDKTKLDLALITYLTNTNPKSTSKKKIKNIAGWHDLDIGPSVSNEIPEGTVSFML